MSWRRCWRRARPRRAGRISAGRWRGSPMLSGGRFGVEYTLAGADLLLHRIGWSLQFPARRAAERDEARIVTWRQKHRNAACVKWGVAPVDGSGPLAGSPKGAERLAASRYGRVGAGPHLLGIFSWRVTIFSVRDCAECGQQLPRSLPGAGRPLAYCSPACRQRAYRGRGGQGSGTTGAERRRRERGASGRPAAPA